MAAPLVHAVKKQDASRKKEDMSELSSSLTGVGQSTCSAASSQPRRSLSTPQINARAVGKMRSVRAAQSVELRSDEQAALEILDEEAEEEFGLNKSEIPTSQDTLLAQLEMTATKSDAFAVTSVSEGEEPPPAAAAQRSSTANVSSVSPSNRSPSTTDRRATASDPSSRQRNRRGSQLLTAMATGFRHLWGTQDSSGAEGASPSHNEMISRRHSESLSSNQAPPASDVTAHLAAFLENRRRLLDANAALARSDSRLVEESDGISDLPKAAAVSQVEEPVKLELFIPKPESSTPQRRATVAHMGSRNCGPLPSASHLARRPSWCPSPTAGLRQESFAFMPPPSRRKPLQSPSSSRRREVGVGESSALLDEETQTFPLLLADVGAQTECTRIERLHKGTQTEDSLQPHHSVGVMQQEYSPTSLNVPRTYANWDR